MFIKQVQEDMRKGEVELEKYVITKSLTKPPEAYPDKNQPHVQVSCSQLWFHLFESLIWNYN